MRKTGSDAGFLLFGQEFTDEHGAVFFTPARACNWYDLSRINQCFTMRASNFRDK
jgi:hypothetical protein